MNNYFDEDIGERPPAVEKLYKFLKKSFPIADIEYNDDTTHSIGFRFDETRFFIYKDFSIMNLMNCNLCFSGERATDIQMYIKEQLGYRYWKELNELRERKLKRILK